MGCYANCEERYVGERRQEDKRGRGNCAISKEVVRGRGKGHEAALQRAKRRVLAANK